jgi:hypothetical protein
MRMRSHPRVKLCGATARCFTSQSWTENATYKQPIHGHIVSLGDHCQQGYCMALRTHMPPSEGTRIESALANRVVGCVLPPVQLYALEPIVPFSFSFLFCALFLGVNDASLVSMARDGALYVSESPKKKLKSSFYLLLYTVWSSES